MRMRSLVIGLFAAFAAGSAESACRAASGEQLLALLELYTSEGCDSCPHADRWLSEHFPAGGKLPAAVLAFHVDYWDRLGWKDRFASPVFTERQHQTMRANRASFVYTPQLVLQGRDYTEWRRGAPARALNDKASRASRARIELSAELDGGAIGVRAVVRMPTAPSRDTTLAIAYTDSRLVTAVKAGENRGVTLTHDHVVRRFETRPVASQNETFSLRLQVPPEAGSHPALVAFVQETTTGDVLQAVTLPLSGCR